MSNSTPISNEVSCLSGGKSPSPISPMNGSPTGILKKQGSVDGSDLPSPPKVCTFCCAMDGLCSGLVCR